MLSRKEIIDLLLYAWNINVATPFDIASAEGFTRLANWLRASNGWTRLQFACEARREDVVRDMLRDDSLAATTTRAAMLGPVGEGGWTALRIAQTECIIDLSDRDTNMYENRFVPDSSYVQPVSESLVRMLQQAAQPWRPKSNDLWPSSFRACAKTVLLVDHRLGNSGAGRSLPTEVWLHVLSFASWDWFIPMHSSSSSSRAADADYAADTAGAATEPRAKRKKR